ncbi:MAG: alpha/beta fold hydrolase [Crocinitomix sp.]|nr:alpha/beta fold hydrolase [Crocinitomix sp.]
MKLLDFENTNIHYRVSGKGDPVIFLHGFLENNSMWDAIAVEISSLGFKTILVDLPCHGESRFDEEVCSMAFMADCINALCEAERFENPFVFGHSMGGYVGLELLKKRPIQLTLVHSNFWNDPADKKKDRNRVVTIVESNKMRLINEAIPNLFAAKNRTKCETIIGDLIAQATTIPSSEIIASTRGMRDRLHNGGLMEKHAVKMIHGSLDTVVKTEQLEQELSLLKNQPTIQTIANAGHMSLWETPNALMKCIKLNLGL